MANEITNTEADVFIPELWRPGFLKALYAAGKVRQRVLAADGDVSQKGDILHIRIAPSLSVNDVGSTDGSVTNQALTPTESQLTIDKWREISFTVLDKAAKQADDYLQPCLEQGVPAAFASDIDAKLLGLHASLNGYTAVDATAGLNEDRLTEAFYALANANVPVDMIQDMSWFFSWKNWMVLRKLSMVSSAQITGNPDGGILTQKIPDVLGIPVYFSTNVQTSTYHKNMLLHREAMACGVQKNFSIEKFARTAKANTYSADILYGVKVVRTSHGILLNTTA
jgi:hypothetical protein